MATAACVQLFRNLMCCIKDLQLFRDTWLYDNALTNRYLTVFPEPLNQTTPLEVMISVAQAFVVVTGVPAAIRLFWVSRRQLQRVTRIVATNACGTSVTDADRLIHASLVKEAYAALRNMFVAFNLFFISMAFVWLSANSWHITAAGWIGGMPALIHALTVMNICLFPLLVFMYKDAGEKYVQAGRMRLLMAKLQLGNVTEADVGLTTLHALSEWSPFWNSDIGIFDSIDRDKEASLFAKEKETVQSFLEGITGTQAAKKKGDNDADETTIFRTRTQRAKANEMKPIMAVTRLEGYREYIYLIVNTIAWYGYSLCVIVYYWPDELKQPDWLRIIMLHYSNDDADWNGNFAGDLMWTTEPLIILLSPFYLQSVRRRRPIKAKED